MLFRIDIISSTYLIPKHHNVNNFLNAPNYRKQNLFLFYLAILYDVEVRGECANNKRFVIVL